MKKLIFAVAIVAFAMISCKGNGKGNANGGSSDSTQMRVPSSQVAYINIDSLVSKYDMYTDLRTEYEVKAKKAEGDLTARGRNFERSVNDFQDKAQKGLMTRSQAAETEESLQKQQQNLVSYRDRVMGEMAEEEQVMLNRIHFSIVDYLKEFNSDNRYGMIISTSASGPILNADPMLDITSIVLEGLNKKYVAEKATQPKETKPEAAKPAK